MKPIIPLFCLILATWLPSVPTFAADAPDTPPRPGDATFGLLQLQSGGAMASRHVQAATTEQREKAVERFLKTYDRAIPETYYGMSVSTKK